MKYSILKRSDSEVYKILKKEEKRQMEGLELIPSENYTSTAVLETLGSIMTDKYSEGFPKARYYGGNEFIDDAEILAQERAKAIFKVPFVNVQPYSGSPANMAVYFALCKPGDTIMGQNLFAGGHLTHGWKTTMSGTYFNSIQYDVLDNGEIDYDQVESLAKEHKPKLIWCGASAYVKIIDFERFSQIAESVGAYLIADISHISGLIIGGVHPSPVEYAHIVTTTTHKTLRGPRGAMIMTTEKGLKKDRKLDKKINKAVFPGLQGGPHNNTTSAIAVALKEASTNEFKDYANQISKNAKTLADALIKKGFKLVGNGTENHLILIDGREININGWYFEKALEGANITVNKNTVPKDTNSPFFPSGIRLGTPAITTRGMKEKDMQIIANFINEVKDILSKYDYVSSVITKEEKDKRKKFVKDIKKDKNIKDIRKRVIEFSKQFPVPGINI